jgi:2-methylcitrate dehydratase
MPSRPDEQADLILARLAEFAAATDDRDVSSNALVAVKNHLLDAMGCALAGIEFPTCRMARQIAVASPVDHGCSVIGDIVRSTPELATFANATMVRCLDFNDSYNAPGGGHPSDFLAALVAISEFHDRSGLELLVGIFVAYEVFAALADVVPLIDRGWDQGLFVAAAAAAGVGRVIGVDARQMAHGISIALTSNVALGVNRSGQLTNWKGCATPHAAMAGLFAARLASTGMTAPAHPFEGHHGLKALVGGEFELGRVGPGTTSAVERAHLKMVPADYETQAPVAAFLELRKEGLRPADVAAIRIKTYDMAWKAAGGGKNDRDAKWRPTSRETADHSIPYLIAVALYDGAVSRDSYAENKLSDPELREFMDRVSVEPDADLSANWIDDPAHLIDIELRDGSVRSVRATRAPGHARNPATDDMIIAKFNANAEGALSEQSRAELVNMVLHLDELPSARPLAQCLAQASK